MTAMFTPAATLTVDNAALVLKEGLRAIAAGQHTLDLSHTATVDSTAVAVMLEWQRYAQQQQHVTLHFGTLSANLQSLIALYGASALLPATS